MRNTIIAIVGGIITIYLIYKVEKGHKANAGNSRRNPIKRIRK